VNSPIVLGVNQVNVRLPIPMLERHIIKDQNRILDPTHFLQIVHMTHHLIARSPHLRYHLRQFRLPDPTRSRQHHRLPTGYRKRSPEKLGRIPLAG